MTKWEPWHLWIKIQPFQMINFWKFDLGILTFPATWKTNSVYKINQKYIKHVFFCTLSKPLQKQIHCPAGVWPLWKTDTSVYSHQVVHWPQNKELFYSSLAWCTSECISATYRNMNESKAAASPTSQHRVNEDSWMLHMAVHCTTSACIIL